MFHSKRKRLSIAILGILFMFLSLMPTGVLAVTSVNPRQETNSIMQPDQNLANQDTQTSEEKEGPKPKFQSYRGPEASEVISQNEITNKMVNASPNIPDSSTGTDANLLTSGDGSEKALYGDVIYAEPNVIGTVYNPNSEVPVVGAKVYFKMLDGTEGYSTFTDVNGEYSLGLPIGKYRVKAYSPSDSLYADSAWEFIELMESEILPLDLSLTTPVVQGSVTDYDGAPVVSGSVSIGEQEDGPWLVETNTNGNGFYKVGAIADGNYFIRARNNQGQQIIAQLEISGGVSTVDPLDLQFSEPNVVGTINNTTGEKTTLPTFIYIKRLDPDRNGWFSESRYIRSGEFAFNLPNGEYYLSAVPRDQGTFTASYTQKITVENGTVIEPIGPIVIALSIAQMEGQVVDALGMPLSNVEVELNYRVPDGRDWRDFFFYNQWVRTDSSGYFQVGGLKNGTYDITAYAEYGESYTQRAYVTNGEYDGPTQLEVHSYNLEGTVSRPDGTPFAGGNVEIRSKSNQGGYHGWARVDDQGHYEAVVPEGEYAVQAMAPQISSLTNSLAYDLLLEEEDLTTQDLELTTPLVTGMIEDSKGFVSDVYITIEDETGNVLDWVNSDLEGAFKLGGVSPGIYILNLNDWRNNRQLSQDIEITEGNVLEPLVLSFPVPNVVGTVFDPGNNTLGNVIIDVYQRQGDYGYSGWYGTESDESGQYELYLKDGEYYLIARPQASSPYARSFSKKIVIENGVPQSTDFSLTLTNPSFTGKVVDSNNEPVSNIRVYLNTDNATINKETDNFNHSWADTDATGTFRFGGITDGYYELYATGSEGESLYTWQKIYKGIPDKEFVELELLPITVCGQVLNPNGSPAFFANVEFEPMGNGPWKDVSTDSEGYYQAALPDGDYNVRALANPDSDYANSYETKVTIENGQVISKNLYLTNPTLIGRVLDWNQSPVPNIWIMIHSIDGNYWGGVNTDSSGNYKFGGVEAGSYLLRVRDQGLYSEEIPATIQDGLLSTVDIPLKAPNFKGTVLGLNGGFTSDARLSINSPTYGQDVSVLSDGNFSLALPDGVYDIWAYSKTDDTIESLPQKFTIQDGVSFDDVVLQLQNPMVHGQVLNADNQPVEGVDVNLEPADDPTREIWHYWSWTETDATGNFALGVVPNGNYQVIVRSPISKPQIYPVTITGGVAVPVNIIANLPRVNVTGKVVAPDGITSIDSFWLSIQKDGEPSWGVDEYQGDGIYELAFEDGTYTIWAYPSGDYSYNYNSSSITITVENGQLKAGENTTIVLEKRPLVHVNNPYEQKQLSVKRFSGSDFSGTNLSSIQNGWETSEYAVFISAENATEHPAGLLLAGHYDAPIFQIGSTGLTQPQIDVLKELGVTKVVVIGLLDSSVETTLSENGITDVSTIVGIDRYDTLVKANQLMLEQATAVPSSVIIASSGIENAQLVSGLAGKYGIPVLMTGPALSSNVEIFLEELNPSNIFLIGNSADYSNLNNEIQRILPSKNLYPLFEDDNIKRNIGIARTIRDNKSILNIPYRTDQSLIASDHSILDLTSAANLGARYDTIPLLTAMDQPSGDLLDYLDNGYWNWDNGSLKWISSPRDSGTRLFVVGGTDLISDEAVNILSIGAGWVQTSKNYEVRGWVEDNVSLTLNGVAVELDPYRNFNKSIVLQPGINKLSFEASRDGETQQVIRYVQYEAPIIDISTSGSLEATVEEYYLIYMNAYGGLYPYTWSLENQPDWLSIDSSTGQVYGTPTAAGTYEFTVKLVDSDQNSITKNYKLVVSEPQSLNITAPTIPVLNVDTLMTSIQLQATGGSGYYTWSALELPEGLYLNSTGLLYGTPWYSGSYSVDINVNDNSTGLSSSVTIQILVNGSTTGMTATPLIQLSGKDPVTQVQEPAGIYVGIDEIKDNNGNTLYDHNIAGYTMEIEFDPAKVAIGDIRDEVQIGEPVINEADKANGLITVVVASGEGQTSDYDKLLFIPLSLKGSAIETTPVTIRFTDLADSDLTEIGVVTSAKQIFQRGKVINNSNFNLRITDAIGGLQYVAGKRSQGFGYNEVNVVNMASIDQSLEADAQSPDVIDIVTLMQYLAKMTDDLFQTR